MADVAQTFYSDPYAAQQAQFARQQKLAEILQQQAFQPDEKFSYAGIEAKPSAAGALAKGLQGGIAAYLQGRSIKGGEDLVKKAESDTTSANDALIKGLSAKPFNNPDADYQPSIDNGQGQMVPTGAAGGYQGALSALSGMTDNPQAQRLAQALTMKNVERDQQLADVAEREKNQRDIIQQNQTFQTQQAEANRQQQESMAKLQAGLTAANQAPVMVPDATSSTGFKYVRPSDAIGQPAYNDKAPFATIGAQPQPGQQAAQVTGDDFLKTLPPQAADQVKALAEGRMPFPGGMALKTPYWQGMISAVSQYDPSFDAVNYNARSKTRNDFTSGTSAKQINAMNTVVGHLQSLSDAADALKNTNVPGYNAVANFAASNTGDPRVKQFDATKKAVVDELTRVWRGSGGSEGDIKTWSDSINSAGSPAQLHGVIGQIGDLVESKINAMGEQYKQGMGTTKSDLQLLTPQSRGVLNLLEKRKNGDSGAATISAADQQALEWANANPNDPRADAIKKKLGQ